MGQCTSVYKIKYFNFILFFFSLFSFWCGGGSLVWTFPRPQLLQPAGISLVHHHLVDRQNLLNPELTNLASLVSQFATRMSYTGSLSSRLHTDRNTHLAFIWVLGIWMLVLTPSCQGLNPQNPLLTPYFYSFCDAGDAMQSFVNTKVYSPPKILYLKQQQKTNYKLK